MQYVYLIMFLVSGYYISSRLKISVEHGVFMYACSSFTILFSLGMVNALTVGIWLISAFVAVSLVLSIVHIIKNKPKISTIITPGVLIIMIAFVVYSIIVKDVRMYQWDEATHWGTTIKYIYGTDKLWTSGLQTIGLPVFNYIITQIAGYSENLLYLSQWFFQWICLSLIVSQCTYRDWKKLIVFALGGYLGMAASMYSGQLSLYADIVLGIMPASIAVSFYLSDNTLKKDIIWLTPAMFMLTQVKNGTGAGFGIIVLAIVLVISIYKKIDKKQLWLLLIPFTTIIVSAVTSSRLTDKFIGGGTGRTSNLGELFAGTVMTYIALGVTIAVAVWMVIAFVQQKKGKKIKMLWRLAPAGIACIAWIGASIAVGFAREGIDVVLIAKTFIKSYGKRLAVYFPMWFLFAVIFICTIVQLMLKADKDKNRLFYGSIWGAGALYTVGIFISYVLTFSPFEANTCASFGRYMATILIFVFVALLASIFLEDDSRHIGKSKVVTYLLIGIFALCIIFYPKEQRTKFLVDYSVDVTKTFRDELAYSVRIINDTVPEDEKVFVIIQDDQGYLYNWFKYEAAPRKINGGHWSFAQDNLTNDTGDWLIDFMKEKGYRYLYVHYSSPELNGVMAEVFSPEVSEFSLYELTDDTLVRCARK